MRTRVFMFLLVAMFGITAIAVGSEPVAYSEMTRMVQVQLVKNGCDPGPQDGLMGPRTQDAIRLCEKRNNLAVTGTITGDLLEKIGLPEIHEMRNVRFRADLIEGLETADGYCQLHDGFAQCLQAESGFPIEIRLIDIVSIGDFDGDALMDVAAIVFPYFGGNAPQDILMIALKKGTTLTAVDTVSLGSSPLSVYVDQTGKIIVRAMKHSDTDPQCCPTILIEQRYHFQNGKLAEDGLERQLTRADIPMIISSLRSEISAERRSAAIAFDIIGGKDVVTAMKEKSGRDQVLEQLADLAKLETCSELLQAINSSGKEVNDLLVDFRTNCLIEEYLMKTGGECGLKIKRFLDSVKRTKPLLTKFRRECSTSPELGFEFVQSTREYGKMLEEMERQYKPFVQ